MSSSLAILSALRALVAAAAPYAEVRGFYEDAVKPEETPADGRIIGERGDPGDPDIELSPLAYTYSHHVPVEICMLTRPGDDDGAIDSILTTIGTMVAVDRTLGGRVTFLDVTAPTFLSEDGMGAVPVRIGRFEFIAEYTVSNPLAG